LAGVTFPPEESASLASIVEPVEERPRAAPQVGVSTDTCARMEVAAIDQAIGRAISSALFGLRDSVHIVDTTSDEVEKLVAPRAPTVGLELARGPPGRV